MSPTQIKDLQKILTEAHANHRRGLKAHAQYKVSDPQTGEDLVQDTFLKTWKYLVRGGKIEMMKAFLYHVLNDLIVDQYRKHKTSSLDTLIKDGFEPSVFESEKLVNLLDGRTAISLINKLPLKYRGIMRMRYVEFLSLKEIAKISNQSPNAVAVQAHRGLKKLKELYQPIIHASRS